jgi:hypothetical protein
MEPGGSLPHSQKDILLILLVFQVVFSLQLKFDAISLLICVVDIPSFSPPQYMLKSTDEVTNYVAYLSLLLLPSLVFKYSS